MNNALWDKVRDVIIVLLIPALGWVLMVSRAIETERIHAASLRDEVADLKRNVERAARARQSDVAPAREA